MCLFSAVCSCLCVLWLLCQCRRVEQVLCSTVSSHSNIQHCLLFLCGVLRAACAPVQAPKRENRKQKNTEKQSKSRKALCRPPTNVAGFYIVVESNRFPSPPTGGTFRNRVASGLKSGVSMNCRNRFASRWRRPLSVSMLRPRFSISASRSHRSTTSRLKAQSNSRTVH